MNIELVEREIRSTANGLTNAIHTREAHPTYGVTKRDLRDRLARLEGMLYCWVVVTRGEASAMHTKQAQDGAEALGINIGRLIRGVEDA